MEIIWKWAAYGKHPAAKDFFKLGQFGPLVQDFSRWVEKGYQLFAARKKFSQNSWRFWTRGLGRMAWVAAWSGIAGISWPGLILF